MMATLVDAITFSSFLSMMGFGLTLVRRTTGVWNVAQAGLVSIGAYVTLTLVSFVGGSPYLYLPLAFLIGAGVGAILFLVAINPLRKASSIILLVATIAFNLILISIINIYADYLQNVFGILSKSFLLTRLDFKIFGRPAISTISVSTLLIFTIAFYLFLRYTRTGLALRGCIEQPSLAGVVGVSVRSLYLLSWVLAGGSAGLAGGFLPLFFQCNPNIGLSLIALMFCVSILGGVGEIYGPFLGGWLVGFVQIFGTTLLASALGPWVTLYKGLFPMVILVLTLLFVPQGLSGIDWRAKVRILKRKGG